MFTTYFQQQQKVDESERDTKIEETETDELTETDPFKPREGVPRQDEPENKKELAMVLLSDTCIPTVHLVLLMRCYDFAMASL